MLVDTYLIKKNRNIMRKIDEIKKFLEVEELNKLEQSAIQGGVGEARVKQSTIKNPNPPHDKRDI